MLRVDKNQCEITMPETYTRLTEEERYQIDEDHVTGSSRCQIASKLNRHRSTICREVSRNRGMRGYRPKQAHHLAQQRQLSQPKPMKLTTGVQALIRQHLQQDWSPEQIQGRLKAEGYSIVCTRTIDAFIEQDKAVGGQLYTHLHHRKPYKKRTGKPDGRGQMIGRLSIDDRPASVDQKTR